MSTYRLGIDIGGTFTDAACVDEQTGEVQIVKVPSTPADPSGGFMAAVARGLHQLSVPVPSDPLTLQVLVQLHEQFHAAHTRAYGYDAREDAVELVNVRLTALGVSPKPRLPALPQGGSDPAEALKGQRPVWFSETSGFTSSPVLDRTRLRWENIVSGPAVIEELDATTLLHPGYQATVDQYGNLLLRRY